VRGLEIPQADTITGKSQFRVLGHVGVESRGRGKVPWQQIPAVGESKFDHLFFFLLLMPEKS
jgi:hypothetical protein